MPVHADLRRRVGRDVQVGAVHLDQSSSAALAVSPSYFTVSLTTSSIVVTPSFTLRRPLLRSVIMPFVDRLAPQLEAGRADENQLAQLLGDFHHFVQTDAALVAGVVALARSPRP